MPGIEILVSLLAASISLLVPGIDNIARHIATRLGMKPLPTARPKASAHLNPRITKPLGKHSQTITRYPEIRTAQYRAKGTLYTKPSAQPLQVVAKSLR